MTERTVVVKQEDVTVTGEQRIAAEELRQAVDGEAASALLTLMVLIKHTGCAECADFWWGVAASVTHDVMLLIQKERTQRPTPPTEHHLPDTGGTTH